MLEFDVPIEGWDHESFAALYEAHRDVVYGVALGLAGPALAADVTQDVFVRIWLAPQRFDPARGSMRTFLVAVTRNVAIDHLRSETSRHRREDKVGADPTSGLLEREPADVAANTDLAVRVADALAGLPLDVREALVTAYWGQLTYRETAEALGAPEGTIKSRIRAGLRHLREELRDHGKEHR